jgi:hypothetical protein
MLVLRLLLRLLLAASWPPSLYCTAEARLLLLELLPGYVASTMLP